MHYYLVITTKRAVKNQDFLTYQSQKLLKPGQIITVPLGKQIVTAIVYKKVVQPNFSTKDILSIVEQQPLPTFLLETILWLGDYYATALPIVLGSILPAGLTKKRRFKKSIIKQTARKKLIPTSAQAQAIIAISQAESKINLLHGITGSGKTTVYLELIEQTLASGKSAIVIVPEIALTAQLISQFSNYFNDLVLLHSKLTEAERHLNWLKCLNAKIPQVIIGARSAVFAPLNNLGLIIIDECHETSLKQDKNPRYSTSRVAAKIASLVNAKVILGSATPNVSDYWLVQKTGGKIIELNTPARVIQKPDIELVDMTKKYNFSHHAFLSDQLLTAITNSLANNQQVLLFHNRRGSSSTTICRDCGYMALCPNCQIPLILHHDKFKLTCHICGYKSPVPIICPECHSSNIDHTGIGTKLIEREVKKHFPKARVARFDADSHHSETIDQIYDQLVSGEIDILIGTQVVTKGLNLPKLTTVGIIQADAGLALPDFVTEERNFQQIAQVVGRVGRDDKPSKIIVQTYRPQQFSIQLGVVQNYYDFFTKTITTRRRLNYPPFCYLLKLKVAYKTEASSIRQAQLLASKIRQAFPKIQIIGPAPAFYERQRQLYNWQLIVKTKKRTELGEIIKLIPATHWQYDIDAESLL